MAEKQRSKLSKVPFDGVLREFMSDAKLRNLSPNTIDFYESILGGFVAYITDGDGHTIIKLSDVTEARAKEYILYRINKRAAFDRHGGRPVEERPLSPVTIHADVRVLKALGTWLDKNGYVNPFTTLEKPKLPKKLIEPLTPDEVHTLFMCFNADTPHGARWQAMLAFFLDTGVRVGEIAQVKLKDVDMTNFRAKVMGKGSKERFVTFGNRTYKMLSRYMNLFRGDGEYLFLPIKGEEARLTTNGIQNIVKRVRVRSGIDRLHCHLFRHTFATNYLIAGGNAFELQELLGHGSLEMTKRYTHLARHMSGRDPEVQRISPLDEITLKQVKKRR